MVLVGSLWSYGFGVVLVGFGIVLVRFLWSYVVLWAPNLVGIGFWANSTGSFQVRAILG